LGLLVRTLAIDRNNQGTLYAGTASGGVYRGRRIRTPEGVKWSWTPYNNGLPEHVEIRDLEVDATTGLMSAATFGRSAYQVITKK
jgi:hypothetical protein